MLARIAFKASCLLFAVLLSFNTKAQLSANFTATPTSGCAPLLVRFTDQSTGNPTKWLWDLGNATTSFLQNPSVTYFTPGKYTIKLVIRNAANTADSLTKTEYITVYAKPTVDFSASATSGCYPLPVQFTDLSTPGSSSISSWQWDFGDGSSSALQNPVHTYTAGGNYNVTLRVINNSGCATTLSKTQYIKINSGVKANFSNTSPSSCAVPVTIDFTNQSTGTGNLNYVWDFGDGNTSTIESPSHQYSVTGTYSVTLIVTNDAGCADTISKPSSIAVGTIRSSFTVPTTTCMRSPITMNNTSIPVTATYSWDFGDGTSSTQTNPVKTYSNPGTYTIRLIAANGTCVDTSYQSVTINSKPTANFTSTDTVSCLTPFEVNFTNNSSNAVSYAWDFGDNSNSSSDNPVHQYNNFGSFTVQLIATNAQGCSDTVSKSSFIRIIKPKVTLKNLPDSGCIPFTKTFNCNIVSNNPVVNITWDFGDGTTGSGPTPTHTYAVQGIYDVKVKITTQSGCTDSAIMLKAIRVGNKPTIDFIADPLITCAKNKVTFTDQSTGGVTSWLWNFGDGSTSTAQNPSHLYSDTGYFTVKLIARVNGCEDSLIKLKYIYVMPPIAKFQMIYNCANRYMRRFTNLSKGADKSFWDFGDGTTDTTRNPIHIFPSTGTFVVKLRVVNLTTGCDFETQTNVLVMDVKAKFTASDTVVCKGTPINFTTGLIPGNINSYLWNFGDSLNPSSGGNTATHTYTAAGRYTVRLIITDIQGCKDTLTKPLYIRVNGPTAKFSPAVPGSCLNSPVQFKDSSISDGINPIVTWQWAYGDNVTDTLTAPPFQHAYSSAGSYAVKLTVTDTKGCSDSYTIPTPLIISKPVANFISTDTLSCPGKPIQFTNSSQGPSLNYVWNFGDGNTSSALNPVNSYAADGNYDVNLSIVDQYGCRDSITKPVFVKIVTPVAIYSVSDSIGTCPPMVVQFTDHSLNAVSKTWDFGDGTSSTTNSNPSHFYTQPGIYITKLTVTGPGGCTHTVEKRLILNGPVGSFTYDPLKGCNPLSINFTATTGSNTSFIWDFNDGTTLSTNDSLVTHSYTHLGKYVPKMILVDRNGCQVPILGRDTIEVDGVEGKFGYINQTFCDSGFVSFTDSSITNDTINMYHWNFGDGGTSNIANPVHQFTTPGIYHPFMVVSTKSGCRDSAFAELPIKVVASPKINISNIINGCTPLTISPRGQLVQPDTSSITWNWDFGNGHTSAIQNPMAETFNIAGVYNIRLMAENSSGCKDSVSHSAEAYALPNVNAGNDTLACKGSGIRLHATGADNYAWAPSATLNCLSCPDPVASPVVETTYSVTGATIHGCTANDTVVVKVQYPFSMRYGGADTLCKGESAHLFASGANLYSWTPSTGLSNDRIANPIATPDTTTIYRVVGADDKGCFRDTGFVKVKVYPIPTVDAGQDKTIHIGKSIDLIPTISPDVTEVYWSPTGAIYRDVYPGVTVRPTQNTEYTVEVKNPGGCSARDKVTIFVICNGANVFIPNTFSPNNDGANDVFYPRGYGLFKIKNLRIYNRWGQVVFERANFNANDASNGWDGTYKGVKLNPDVFVYTIDLVCENNSVLTYKGNVALIQ